MDFEDLVERLRKRAEIRRHIPSRKSVQEGKPDRLADLLEEASYAISILNEAHQNIIYTHCNDDKRPEAFYISAKVLGQK